MKVTRIVNDDDVAGICVGSINYTMTMMIELRRNSFCASDGNMELTVDI